MSELVEKLRFMFCELSSDNTSSKGISWDPCDVGGTVMPRGGLGSDAAVEGLFMPT